MRVTINKNGTQYRIS